VARDSIVTVGQAIRREVAAMGDGVERALARAGELETLVQNEVAALERTYSDNEVRIRGLLQDLANQRDTLVGQAEQVRSAINNVHIDLTQDLSTISDLVGQQVNEAAQRITHSLAEKGEHITLALGQVGDGMIQQLSVRGNDLLVRLENASEETSRAISTASDQLTSNLNFKTDHVGEDFAEIVSGLDVSTQAHILLLLRELRMRLGLTMVFISHDLSVVRVLCDDVAILQHGEVVEYGPVAQIFNAPQHPYTRQLLSAIPLPDVEPGWLDDSSPLFFSHQQGTAA